MNDYDLSAGAQFVDGAFGHGTGDTEFSVVNPADGSEVRRYLSASSGDVDTAMDAAARAFPEWSNATPAERSEALHSLADCLRELSGDLARAETRETGKPIRLSTEFDVPGTVDNAAFFAGAARQLDGAAAAEYSPDHTSSVRREAIGVVASIAPWNYPLQMAGWKIFPAVAAGNTIVLKPAEITPTTALLLAAAAKSAGVPDGVINILNGGGPTVGAAMMSHQTPKMVSFTGSTTVGTSIAATASATAKRTHLELGGKAPFLVFDDANLDSAIRGAVAGSLINSGQDCTAATRAYVQRPLYDAFVTGVAELMGTVRLGQPLDTSTDMGPLSSRRHQQSVAAIVDRARRGGATVVRGGSIPRGELASGFFYEPTLIIDADQRSEIVQKEVFGPVLVVLPFDSDEEGLALANDTVFGLAASAWTTDIYRAQRASRELQAGCVWLNDHIPIVSEMPHGGVKQSGHGKDMSKYSFDEYTNVKHVMSDILGTPSKPWHSTIFGR